MPMGEMLHEPLGEQGPLCPGVVGKSHLGPFLLSKLINISIKDIIICYTVPLLPRKVVKNLNSIKKINPKTYDAGNFTDQRLTLFKIWFMIYGERP